MVKNICFRCGREIGEATWDAQSAEHHRIVLELLKEDNICESCEFSLVQVINEWRTKLNTK